jgi:hypothetical protein
MNLTLEIEELDQDIFIVNINSPLAFSELVYFINHKKKANFVLDKNGYALIRKKTPLLFPYYVDFKEDDNHSYIISNLAYSESAETPSKGSLFDEEPSMETKHFLQPGIKKHNYFFLSAEAVKFNNFESKHLTLFTDSKHISEYNKREQDLFQQIYYEKQS